MKRLPRHNLGFSIIELVFVSGMASMLFLTLVLGITGMGYSQTKSERLFAADMLLGDLAESAMKQPFDDLSELSGSSQIQLSGFEFQAQTEIKEFEADPEISKVVMTLSWDDRSGKQSRACSVLRAKEQ